MRKAKSARKSARTRKSTDPGARTVYLGLGSNLGDRGASLAAALDRIALMAPLSRVSSVYESDPVGFELQPRFWNLVAAIEWGAPALALLSGLKAIERSLGRRRTFRNGPRTIDCDILDFGGRVATGERLTLPHARLAERRFVLAPLAEIAPRWRHPVLGLTARQLLRRRPTRPYVKRLRASSILRGLPGHRSGA